MRDINGSKPTSFPLDEEKLSFKIPCPDRPPRVPEYAAEPDRRAPGGGGVL